MKVLNSHRNPIKHEKPSKSSKGFNSKSCIQKVEGKLIQKVQK